MGVSHRETRREGKDGQNEIQKAWVRVGVRGGAEQRVRQRDGSENKRMNPKLCRRVRQSVGKASCDRYGWLPFSRTGRIYCLQDHS